MNDSNRNKKKTKSHGWGMTKSLHIHFNLAVKKRTDLHLQLIVDCLVNVKTNMIALPMKPNIEILNSDATYSKPTVFRCCPMSLTMSWLVLSMIFGGPEFGFVSPFTPLTSPSVSSNRLPLAIWDPPESAVSPFCCSPEDTPLFAACCCIRL